MTGAPVYLDYQATTPVDPFVHLDKVLDEQTLIVSVMAANNEIAVRRRPHALGPRSAPSRSATTLSAIPQPRPTIAACAVRTLGPTRCD